MMISSPCPIPSLSVVTVSFASRAYNPDPNVVNVVPAVVFTKLKAYETFPAPSVP